MRTHIHTQYVIRPIFIRVWYYRNKYHKGGDCLDIETEVGLCKNWDRGCYIIQTRSSMSRQLPTCACLFLLHHWKKKTDGNNMYWLSLRSDYISIKVEQLGLRHGQSHCQWGYSETGWICLDAYCWTSKWPLT